MNQTMEPPTADADSPIVFDRVSKRYGNTNALSSASFSIPAGSVVGLVGRNGAGKSTALRCLAGLARPSAGSVRLLGVDPASMSAAIKQRVGFMAEQALPFPAATAAELIRFCQPLYQRWDKSVEQEMIKRFQVNVDRKLAKLSMGQQRTVALLLALCPRPDVLVLDEPAANLDPVMRREFLNEILGLVSEQGRTVILSTHAMGDVERIADRVLFLDQGRVLLHRPLDELKENIRRLRLIFPGDAPSSVDVPGMLKGQRAGREWLITVDGFFDELPAQVAARTGAQVDVQAVGLEDLFLDLADRPGVAA